MSSNIDFKQLWNQQEVETPKKEELFKKANKFKKNTMYKLIAVNFMLLISLVFFGTILYCYNPVLLITKIGLVLVVIGMLVFVANYNRMIPLLFKRNLENIDSREYLKRLLEIKEKQLYQQTTMLNIYFILLSLGISFYMFEYILKRSVIFRIFAYVLLLFWIAINWFYLRPKTIKKEQEKTDALIQEFKRLNEQFLD